MSQKGKITKEQIKEAIGYIFKSKEVKRGVTIYDRNSLEIYEDKEILSFKIGTLMTGILGFKNLVETHNNLNNGESAEERFTTIYYNGRLLNEQGRQEFWKQTYKRFENYESL